MADYYPLLAKAIAGLPSSDTEQRTAIYERARKALVGQLRSITPPVAEADIERESQALDSAIARLEAEFAQRNTSSASAPHSAAALRKTLPPLPPLPPKLDLSELAKTQRPKPISQPISKLDEKTELKTELTSETKSDAPAHEPVAPPAQTPFVASRQKEKEQSSGPPKLEPAAPVQLIQERPVLPPHPPSSKPLASTPAPSFAAPSSPSPPNPLERPILVAEKDPIFAPITTHDLSLAQIEARPKLTPLRFLFGLAVLIGMILTAILAFYWRDNPQGTARSLPLDVPVAQETVETPSKIVERIGGPQAQQAAPTEASLSQSQRAALLIEAPEEPQKFKTYLGTVSWRLESMGRGQGQALAQAIRIEADISEANLKLTLLIQKNIDQALPASHTISMRFAPQPNSTIGEVTEIDLPLTRNENSSEIDPLVGVMAKITQNMFLIGLNNDPVIRTRNFEFLKARNWLDIPMRLSNGRIAKITFEKGSAGERVMLDALAAWR